MIGDHIYRLDIIPLPSNSISGRDEFDARTDAGS